MKKLAESRIIPQSIQRIVANHWIHDNQIKTPARALQRRLLCHAGNGGTSGCEEYLSRTEQSAMKTLAGDGWKPQDGPAELKDGWLKKARIFARGGDSEKKFKYDQGLFHAVASIAWRILLCYGRGIISSGFVTSLNWASS